MNHLDPYNPLDLEALGNSLMRALMLRSPVALGTLNSFSGSGIYALYYLGAEEPYAVLGEFNRENECRIPIYVGRANAPGARTGNALLDPVREALLFERVAQHRQSIRDVERAKDAVIPLRVADFKIRTLVCLPIWVPLAEAMAIRSERPLWNSRISGFGIKVPGEGRSNQRRSQWDTIHAGRKFARSRPANATSVSVLVERARDYANKQVVDAATRLASLSR